MEAHSKQNAQKRRFLQLSWEDPKAFPGQPSDIVTPARPVSSPRSPPRRTGLEHLPREASRGHLILLPTPPQLALLDVEEQRLYPGDRAPHPISNSLFTLHDFSPIGQSPNGFSSPPPHRASRPLGKCEHFEDASQALADLS